MDRWFIVPLVQPERPEGAPENLSIPSRPKYAELVDNMQSREIPNSDEALVLFSANEEVIREIEERDDSETLSEVEALEIQHEISQEQRDTQPEPPIEPGSGDTIEDRLNDVIAQTEERLSIGGPGITVAEPLMNLLETSCS